MAGAFDTDYVIAGAGPVGSVLALLLARSGHHCLVLDRSRFPRDKVCGEGLMPSGVAVLTDAGLDLDAAGFPRVTGVRYRLPGVGSTYGGFRESSGAPGHGHGVRRLLLDAMLAETLEREPDVELHTGRALTGLRVGGGGVEVGTDGGAIRCRGLVGADGLRSRVRSLLGWDAPARPPHRLALVAHFEAPRHGLREIVVTLLETHEVYAAPAGPDCVLAAVLGDRDRLRFGGLSAAQTHRAVALEAMPELAGAACSRPRGAGPFRVTPKTIASGPVFLAGDAAGFIDPLTGDGLASGLVAAQRLARLLDADPAGAAARYRAWHRGQWRRRRLITALTLMLTGSRPLARRALAGTERRPEALRRLLEVNSGTRGFARVGLRDWAALAGF